MRLLVSGATGYIGKHLLLALLEERIVVGALCRDPKKISTLSPAVGRIVHGADSASIMAAVSGFGPDLVVHLASNYLASHKSEDVESLITSNVLYGSLILEGMKKCNCTKIVNIGSIFQNFLDERYNPTSLYAATKQAFEDIVKYYAEACGLSSITLKLTDTYGPDDTRGKIIALFRKIAKSQETLAMSPGQQIVNLVHVDDVIGAISVAIEMLVNGSAGPSQVFFVSSKESMSLRDLAITFEQASGRKLNIEWGAREYRPRELMRPWIGSTLPGWTQEISLMDGLRKLTSND